jgi:hypothetical protein
MLIQKLSLKSGVTAQSENSNLDAMGKKSRDKILSQNAAEGQEKRQRKRF